LLLQPQCHGGSPNDFGQGLTGAWHKQIIVTCSSFKLNKVFSQRPPVTDAQIVMEKFGNNFGCKEINKQGKQASKLHTITSKQVIYRDDGTRHNFALTRSRQEVFLCVV
jgi:hypothetical protein